MSLETQAERFIEVLKELDGSAGNQRMRSELGWQESTYNRIKEHLLEEGRIRPGRGRGGSVSLAQKSAVTKAAKRASSLLEKPVSGPTTPAKPPKADKSRASTSANLGFEAKLWLAADKLRNNMDAAEYKHVVLGLIFLKYISDTFEEHARQARRRQRRIRRRRSRRPGRIPRRERLLGARRRPAGRTCRPAPSSPPSARSSTTPWSRSSATTRASRACCRRTTPAPALDKHRLGELIDLIGTIGLGDEAEPHARTSSAASTNTSSPSSPAPRARTAASSTRRSCVVRVLVEMLAPYKGRIYDPCCGSGGMFVQSEKFVEAHGGKLGDISIYGQESNATTRRLAMMNLAIRGIEADFGPEHADTFRRDLHPDLRADYVLANPPFNDSDWFRKDDDVRWQFGVPPKGNANFAWVQHFIHHLAPNGMAGFILGNISLTSETGGEDQIRKGIVDANLIECIVTLPDKLFFATPIPVGIWILNRARTGGERLVPHHREILFIDAGRLGKEVTRTHRELTDADINKIAETYRNWSRAENNYHDVEGFCRSVPVAEVADKSYSLLPAAYVNAGRKDGHSHIRVADVFKSPQCAQVSEQLQAFASLSGDFDKTMREVRLAISALESKVTFETRMLGELLEVSNERLGDAPEPEVLTCTESGGLILQRERFAKRVATDDASNYKVVRKGDVVYNPYLLWKGSIDQCWIVDVGITSPAYEIFRVREGFDPTIVGQLVISPEMIKRYDGISFGTVQRRRRAPPDKFLELEVNVPAHEHLSLVSNLLRQAQECQFASRNSERSIKEFLRLLCHQLR